MPNDFWVQQLRWSVFWYSRKKKKYVRKRFGDDFYAALKFYELRRETNYNATLHVDNHSFPPPSRITAYERVDWKVVVRNGRRYKKKVVTTVNLMNEYNTKGIWWCGYCIQLRRFVQIDTDKGPEMYCPVCIASHRINKRYNPKAITLEMHKAQRRTNGDKRRRRIRR